MRRSKKRRKSGGKEGEDNRGEGREVETAGERCGGREEKSKEEEEEEEEGWRERRFPFR